MRFFDHFVVAYFFGPPCIAEYSRVYDRVATSRYSQKDATFIRQIISSAIDK